MWIFALASVLLRKHVVVLHEPGKLAGGPELPLRESSPNQGQLQKSICGPVCTSLYVHPELRIQSELPVPTNTSGCSLSSRRTPSRIRSHPLLKPAATVPVSAYPFQINNDGPDKECREGHDGALRHDLAGGVWNSTSKPRGICDSSNAERGWHFDGSAGRLHTTPSSGDRQHGSGRYFGGPQQDAHRPWHGGGRFWDRAGFGCDIECPTGRLRIWDSEVPERIRPSDRHSNPMFLSRVPTGLAAVFLLDGEGLRLDSGTEFREASLLLGGRELCGSDPKGCWAKGLPCSSKASGSKEEGDNSFLGRPDIVYIPDLAGYHSATPSASEATEEFRAGSTEFPGCAADSSSPECVSYRRWTSYAKGLFSWFCSSSWSCPQNEAFTYDVYSTAFASQEPTGGTPGSHFRARPRDLPEPGPRHDCCDLPTEPSYDCAGGASGQPGPIVRPGLGVNPSQPFYERCFKEGKTTTAAGREEWRFLPSGCPECYEENSSHGSPAVKPGGFPQEGHSLKVPRTPGRFCPKPRLRFDHVDVGSDSGRYGGQRHERSSGAAGPHLSDGGTSRTGRLQVGSCIHPLAAAGSTSDLVHLEDSSGEPSSEGIRTFVPTAVGHHGIGLHQGIGCDHQPQKRSRQATKARQGPGCRQARSKPEEKEVSQKTKGRRNHRILGSHNPRIVSQQVAPGRPGEVFALGSEPVACKGSASDELPPPTWESLQSFSFARWCSSLCRRVLNSRTAFGAFVSQTLQIHRWSGSPAKLLFPLPVPRPGTFEKLHPRVSSRHRRKQSLNQALHIVVMALNFLHADCSFVNMAQLSKPPNPEQIKAIDNIKGLIKAFGNRAGVVNVPASGRRSTNVVSLLADLSEFLTLHGLNQNSYERGCPAFVGVDNAEVPTDFSRAEELNPYRSLDASRLKLAGTAAWDPAEYLGDEFLLPFLEPEVLRWKDASYNVHDVPNLDREDAGQVLALSKLWDRNGLLHLSPGIVPADCKPSCIRVFNAWKNSSTDRQIGDRRGRNQLEAYLPGPSRRLPCGWHLACLEVDPRRERLAVCISDRKDYYHQIMVTSERSKTNKLWPLLPSHLLHSTRAFEIMMQNLRGDRITDREVIGDGLAAAVGNNSVARMKSKKGPPVPQFVHACFNSVIQGDHLGVEIATQAHRGLLVSEGLLDASEEITSSKIFSGRETVQGLVIDDYFAVSIEPAAVDPRSKHPKTRAKARFDLAQSAYQKAELAGSAEKDVIDADHTRVIGAELDSSPETRKHNLVTLSTPAAKRLAMAYLSLELSRMRWTSDALHASLLGAWNAALMYRRPLMCILDRSYSCFDLSVVDRDHPKLKPLSRQVAQELVLLGTLVPLVATDLSAKLSCDIFASDASDKKGAVTHTTVPEDLARALHRAGTRKPGYHRMLRRDEALREKVDEMYEPVADDTGLSPESLTPEKPLAMKYHFIEICGGAGKIAGCLESHGWKVGPVIDIERSVHFDLSFLTVLSWVYHLIEQGRLDGCFIAPPCTTFSPAAFPCLRSYKCPRGFNPKHPRTLKGTELALRALSILFLCHRTETICVIEQPRRSKMAWLRERVRLLDFHGARETWLASCNFNSPHQKEFRLIGVNLDIHQLHHPCTKDHTHIRIEGRYTKPSATYTDALASRIAQVFDEALTCKLRVASVFRVKTGGLESPIVNDVATSLGWNVLSVWAWKKPSHINIQEATAYGRLAYHMAQFHPKTRFTACLDSHVALAAISKGRSPSHGLRPTLRRIGATTVAGCLYPSIHFMPTRLNPADHPTRDNDLPTLPTLWAASPQTLRNRFQKILQALDLHALPDGLSRGLDLGSLRAGGASWLLMVSEDSELVRRRGRWINHKIMEVYVQEVAALQFLPRLDVNTRNRILRGTRLFPLVLNKLSSFVSAGIPEVAWRILLVTDGAMTAVDGS